MPTLLWETDKAALWGKMISFSFHKKRHKITTKMQNYHKQTQNDHKDRHKVKETWNDFKPMQNKERPNNQRRQRSSINDWIGLSISNTQQYLQILENDKANVCTLFWFYNYFVFFMWHVTVCVHIAITKGEAVSNLRSGHTKQSNFYYNK